MVKKWYALKVFYNRFSEIEATLSCDGIESYIPMKTRSYPQPNGEVVTRRVPLVAMLMFLRCDDDYISSLNSILDGKAMVYHHLGTQIPAPFRMKRWTCAKRITTIQITFIPRPGGVKDFLIGVFFWGHAIVSRRNSKGFRGVPFSVIAN